jgi:hypothetical protein
LQLKCCGTYGFEDYAGTVLPQSCCENDQAPCSNPFKAGCARALTDGTKGYLETIGALSAIISVLSVSNMTQLTLK